MTIQFESFLFLLILRAHVKVTRDCDEHDDFTLLNFKRLKASYVIHYNHSEILVRAITTKVV